jgi:prepilin-type processing-associated H-X9-DG protein
VGDSKQVFRCPARNRSSGGWSMPSDWAGVILNYGYAGLGGYSPTDGSCKLGKVRYPARSMMVADCAHREDGQSQYRVGYAGACRAGCQTAVRTPENTVHNNGSNLAFVDGHVSYMKTMQIIAGWGRTLYGARWHFDYNN